MGIHGKTIFQQMIDKNISRGLIAQNFLEKIQQNESGILPMAQSTQH